MERSPSDGPVLVAVADPTQVEQLVRTAGDLARVGAGTVKLVSVVAKSRSSPVTVYSDETIIERFAEDTQQLLDRAAAVAPADIEVDRETVVDRSVGRGLLTVVDRTDPRALVVGWEIDPSRADSILGTNVDRLLKRAPCDVYVERVGYEAGSVESILLPVAGGPHVRPAAAAAKAIAARNDATVHVVSVTAADGGSESGRDHVSDGLEHLDAAPGPDVKTESSVMTDGEITDVIARELEHHDIAVFGVTRRRSISRRLLGSIPKEVAPQTDSSVIVARSRTVVDQGAFRRLRRLWRGS
jgi:nucleotide-binding universal stress UspA family protein